MVRTEYVLSRYFPNPAWRREQAPLPQVRRIRLVLVVDMQVPLTPMVHFTARQRHIWTRIEATAFCPAAPTRPDASSGNETAVRHGLVGSFQLTRCGIHSGSEWPSVGVETAIVWTWRRCTDSGSETLTGVARPVSKYNGDDVQSRSPLSPLISAAFNHFRIQNMDVSGMFSVLDTFCTTARRGAGPR